MAKKVIKLYLSKQSIQDAITYLNNYNITLEKKTKLIAEKLAELGVEVARVQLADLDAIFTSELISSVHSEYVSSVPNGIILAVVAGTDHCAFVEFGTGMIGKQSPYPYKLPAGVQWQYATGKTIRQLTDGRYGWFYPADDGNWYFTEGMPARPYMYNTYIELVRKARKVVKEVMDA